MTDPDWTHLDAVLACADLVNRTGATGFELGCTDDTATAGWYAHAQYRGVRITAEHHASPSAAALGLAERILGGATCACGQPITLTDQRPGCRWQLLGRRWTAGCDAPPIHVHGERGDLAAARRALEETR